jgi:hypothetical protein
MAVAGELQRDWARQEQAAAMAGIFLEHAAEPGSRWLGSFSFSVKRRAPEHSPAHCAPKKHTQPVWSTS